ncbi:cocaine esterase-like isoform X2 [Watersipora subatra]|uniref:cocaine esterase-like isoform X2 n=1 Tax=Watersipora subatra TaxID=2589382 RepID=UPI00355C2B17
MMPSDAEKQNSVLEAPDADPDAEATKENEKMPTNESSNKPRGSEGKASQKSKSSKSKPGIKKTLYLAATLCCCSFVRADPVVTLSHGGQLKGLSTSFLDKPVDLFLGVRYAEPPTGYLRFKKPIEATWDGVMDATDVGNPCSQFEFPGLSKVIGDEDCLFLYVTVPGKVQAGAKKPVMVWIHGGGYTFGTGMVYVGGPLATFGDVIVVTINYRLGPLGFLFEGSGTGNYGLWDQRAALLWVQKNIAQFGGDPDLVTIFGESAGGGSVSAQTMSPHNDGLFKRAIQESGTLFLPWSWDLSSSPRPEMNKIFRQDHCPSMATSSIYDCLQNVPVELIFASASRMNIVDSPFKPSADEDFFAKDININSYQPAQRFELMSGVNGQEGVLFYALEISTPAAMSNDTSTLESGPDKELIEEFLMKKCVSSIAPLSPNLCVQQIIDIYELDTAVNGRERASRLIEFLGDHYMAVDITFGLDEHAASPKPTYAYYFTELTNHSPDLLLWPSLPSGVQVAADHADELLFVFGTPFIKDNEDTFWREMLVKDPTVSSVMVSIDDKNKELSQMMMYMWTNFAKSGNPNEPVALPEGTPVWPQFNNETNYFLELKSGRIRLVTTPNQKRVHRLRKYLYADRELQRMTSEKKKGQHDEL